MTKAWKNRDNDLKMAWRIIDSYHQLSEEINTQEHIALETETPQGIVRADWVVALEEAFEDKYGNRKGHDVACKVLTTLITQNETFH
jgi:hypothetical protein